MSYAAFRMCAPDAHPARETDVLARVAALWREHARDFPRVTVGPGDDCAVLAPAAHALPTLLKVDQVVEGRHFTRQTPLPLVARKALARAVSDIAAMAGTPVAALVSAVVPAWMHTDDVRVLVEALHDAGRLFACPIVGGDTAWADKRAPLVLSVTVLGEPATPRGVVLRSTARVGDFVYLTGSVGGSFEPAPSTEFAFPGGGRHLTFPPRVAEARELATLLGAALTAMMDTSDGLGLDANRLARASGVRMDIDAGAIPLTRPGEEIARALAEGEDYELLFTVAPGATVPALLATGTRATRIGTVAAWSEGDHLVVLRGADGTTKDISGLGFEHRA